MARLPIISPVLPMGADRDPLSRYRDGAVVAGTRQPIPLVATQIRVEVRGGIALVRTERRFRNAEAGSIEATITFPVPVQATLFGLTAHIGDRLLHATARRREEARAGYESAMDRGKTAVLHEEVLRGVHMLSVGHVPSGAEIAVAADWVMPLSLAEDGAAALRIPTTVGEVYGRSPLADSDDLITDAGVLHEAELEVVCSEGEVSLAGGPALAGGRARLRLARPIDLRVAGWMSRDLYGLAADGRGVTLNVAPAPAWDAPISAVVLVDRSGSMASPVDGTSLHVPTKHAAVVKGLRAAAEGLHPGDNLRLWEFDNAASPVLARRGGSLVDAVASLQPPRGGTETGAAIAAVLAAESAQDVVLITDGQTYALDVQAAARSGRRFTVVLIGEDSLEANVGTLAALTGGQVFVAGSDVASVVRLALATLRAPHAVSAPAEARPAITEVLIGGMRVTAVLGSASAAAVAPSEHDVLARAVGALAAALTLPRLPVEAAAALAEAEGLCCHLTSLMLVDEAGEAQEGIPAQRKVPLMASRLSVAACAAAPAAAGGIAMVYRASGASVMMRRAALPPSFPSKGPLDIPTFLRRQPNPGAAAAGSGGKVLGTKLAVWLGHVDWSRNPEALRRGELDGLPPDLVRAVEQVASDPDIAALAWALHMPAVVLVLALLARSEPSGSRRYAARFARAVLGAADAGRVAEAARCIGL